MTGSGSTLFALFADPGEARRTADALRAEQPAELRGAWVEASVTGTPYPPDVVSVEEGS
jgi:4-diphosphocytidyl-2C-methyl-D-erythritol kinase